MSNIVLNCLVYYNMFLGSFSQPPLLNPRVHSVVLVPISVQITIVPTYFKTFISYY